MSRASAWWLFAVGWCLVAAAWLSAVSMRISWSLMGGAGVGLILAGAIRLGEKNHPS